MREKRAVAEKTRDSECQDGQTNHNHPQEQISVIEAAANHKII
jgi:hypothetical protein